MTVEPIGMSEILRRWLESIGKASVDVELAGEVFGGRPGEAPQQPREVQVEADRLVLRFNPTETLTVLHPSSVEIHHAGHAPAGGDLVIAEADEVTWGWHYYGRPETPENWCTQTYRFDGDMVVREVSGPIRPFVRAGRFPRRGAVAVRLVPS